MFGRAWSTLILTALAVVVGAPASAHEAREVGPLTISIGWVEEPPLAGFENGIEVGIERGGSPVRTADLEVELFFGILGGQGRSQTRPLQPVFDSPGEFTTPVIPTRPGTYTFNVSGTAAGVSIDETFTSGPDTFDDVRTSAELEFPVADPSRGELAERLERIDARAGGGTTLPLVLSIVAALIAIAALVVALRSRRA